MLFRSGFLARLPAAPLDGELWLGRGRFEAMVALVQRRGGTDADWSAVRYQVFERPGGEGDFATRAALLAGLCPGEGPAQAVTQSRLGDRQALRERLAAVLAQGGEGLVLHRADSPWHTGRSPDLLKLKPVHDDEAEVIGHEAGHGRLQGLCGALLVRDGAGRVFRLGSGLSDAQRRAPPALGSTVSFRHRGRTGRGWPRQPTFWRLAERPAADIVRA